MDSASDDVDDSKFRFLRNAWYLCGWTAGLNPVAMNSVDVLGDSILLLKLSSGKWSALENICCHRLVPLTLGRREGDCVRCMYHGLKFASDGRCVEIPGHDRIPSAIKIKSYPAFEKHGGVWVWMGDPSRANPDMVPPIAGDDDPSLAVANAEIDIAGSATLIWDNLNDLSHVPFVHHASFAGGDPKVIESFISGETRNNHVEVRELGIRSSKWHLGLPGHYLFSGLTCDEFLVADFIAPGVLIIRVESYKAGVRDRYPNAIPPEELLSLRVACQVVTPTAAASSRIFFNIGTEIRFAEHTPRLLDIARQALAEDKIFIDGQQALMRENPGRKPLSLSMDVAVVRFQSVMRRLLAAEERELASASSSAKSKGRRTSRSAASSAAAR